VKSNPDQKYILAISQDTLRQGHCELGYHTVWTHDKLFGWLSRIDSSNCHPAVWPDASDRRDPV